MSRSERYSYVRDKARAQELDQRRAKVRELNDRFRTTLMGGRVMITPGVRTLPPLALSSLLDQVSAFSAFTSGNDPYDEHDFGSIDVGEQRFFWKIDFYDKQLELGSPDPSDPDVTARVLTIMLAEEY